MSIARVEEIQVAIESLPYQEYVRLRQWLSERDWENWDRQIEADSESGKLDFLIEEALNEKATGILRELQMHRTTSRFWECFGELPVRLFISRKLAGFGLSESESSTGHLRLTMEKTSFGFGLVHTTNTSV